MNDPTCGRENEIEFSSKYWIFSKEFIEFWRKLIKNRKKMNIWQPDGQTMPKQYSPTNFITGIINSFFGLFYSRYWIIFPIKNTIFFPQKLWKLFSIENCKIQKIWNEISKVFKIKNFFAVTVFKWWKMSSKTLILCFSPVFLLFFFPIFNKTPLKFSIPWVWVMFQEYWKKSLIKESQAGMNPRLYLLYGEHVVER